MVRYSYKLNALVCDKCRLTVEVDHVTNPETLAIRGEDIEQRHICASKHRKRVAKPQAAPVQDDVWGTLYRHTVALHPELAIATA